MRPTGTLTKKTERQPKLSIKGPPIKRAEDGRCRERARPDAERLRALLPWRKRNREDRHRGRIIRRRGDSLDHAERRSSRAGSKRIRRKHRADDEYRETEDVNALAADRVAELAPDGHEDRVGDDIGGRDPCGGGDGDIEARDDLRQREVDDGLVEASEKRTDDNGCKHQPSVYSVHNLNTRFPAKFFIANLFCRRYLGLLAQPSLDAVALRRRQKSLAQRTSSLLLNVDPHFRRHAILELWIGGRVEAHFHVELLLLALVGDVEDDRDCWAVGEIFVDDAGELLAAEGVDREGRWVADLYVERGPYLRRRVRRRAAASGRSS